MAAKEHPAQNVAQPPRTAEELQIEINHLRAENEGLKGGMGFERELLVKVSSKGGVSVYGLGRFPATYYVEQWRRLLDAKQRILDFIAENEHLLRKKGDA